MPVYASVLSKMCIRDRVSEYPTTNTMGGSQNPNLSYYPFVAYITPEDGKGLTNGAYVDISLATQGDTDSLYISQMYVKKEDNRYFVYARNQQTGLLEKRYVTIGKSLYGSYYPVSYTHLDVYKRQMYIMLHM